MSVLEVNTLVLGDILDEGINQKQFKKVKGISYELVNGRYYIKYGTVVVAWLVPCDDVESGYFDIEMLICGWGSLETKEELTFHNVETQLQIIRKAFLEHELVNSS